MDVLEPYMYEPQKQHTLPARSGIAVALRTGQTFKVINTHGTQVVDFWAFPIHGLSYVLPPSGSLLIPKALSHPKPPKLHVQPVNHLSMSHTRATTLHLSPQVGDKLYTNHRQPILELIQDTSPGGHDTLFAACDLPRYHLLGVPQDKYHDNCSDNCRNALKKDLDIAVTDAEWYCPQPLNLFMNIPVTLPPDQTSLLATHESGAQKHNTVKAGLSFDPPLSKKGDHVVFRVVMDCVVVMSACPQDILDINGEEKVTREAHFIVDG